MSGAYIEQAARVTDGVEHTGTDWAVGLSVVFIAGGFFLAPLSVAGVIAVVGTARFVQSLGGVIDRNLPKEIAERIDKGARTVFMDEPRHPAAMAVPTTTLTRDHGHWVCKGSDVVLIERYNASRIGDTTSCGGRIAEGSSTIFIGGVSVLAPGAPENPNEVIGDDLYRFYDTVLWAGSYASLPKTAWSGAVYVATAVNDVVPSHIGSNALLAEGARSHAVKWTQALGRFVAKR